MRIVNYLICPNAVLERYLVSKFRFNQLQKNQLDADYGNNTLSVNIVLLLDLSLYI